jgi:hypothetical protein
MACRQEPDPAFVRRLGLIFSNPFRLRWVYEAGYFSLEEYARHRQNGTGRWYWVMNVYPYEQGSQVIELLRRNNLRNDDAHAEELAKSIEENRKRRLARPLKTQAEAAGRFSEIGGARSFAKVGRGPKLQDKSWREGFVRSVERGGDS